MAALYGPMTSYHSFLVSDEGCFDVEVWSPRYGGHAWCSAGSRRFIYLTDWWGAEQLKIGNHRYGNYMLWLVNYELLWC